MKRLLVVSLVVVVFVAGCGGDDGSTDAGANAGVENPASDAQGSADDSGAGDGSGAGGSGSFEDPTPEASGELPPNGIRIGDNVWVRTTPATGQCFVQEGEGVTPFAVWGSLDNDDSLSVSVSTDQDGGFGAEITGNTMFWVAGSKDGSELSVDHDFASQTVSGSGLFYNLHTDEWAYSSFEFTCP